jgi:asparagine synthase (glutamine-hydrolysing)
MNRAVLAGQLLRYFGPGWLIYRAWYAFQLRTGWLRRKTPSFEWTARPLATWLRDPQLADPACYLAYRRQAAPAFFFKPDQQAAFQGYFDAWDQASERTPVDLAEAIQRGEFTYFDHTTAATGLPPDWHANPFTGQHAPADRHWSAIDDFGFGDIKLIWEVNRFGFTYALVRAYWRTGDERYAEVFWRLVEDWRSQNPPYRGPNWKCGQETTFRVMAWCFGLWGFLAAQATTPERVVNLAQLIAVSGERIAGNFAYALSQRNNHGISEALGLWTIGTLFPELTHSTRWQQQGRAALEQQARQLIYDDGSFAQHSVNYHRLMLHDYVWVLRLAALNQLTFSDTVHEHIRRASEWLYQLQDERSGRLPNYGQNDGALILPLTNADYQDFRPVLQGACYLTAGTRTYAAGPWDEELLWLCGPEALKKPQRTPLRADFTAPAGGYQTLRSEAGFVFTRCARLRHRPAQADMLHVDVWWQGYNIACDAGTYSYHALAPWNNALAGTACHNTVTVDGYDQMAQAGKFLWLPWLHGRVRYAGHDDLLAYWQGEHDGYRRLTPPVLQRRGIVRLPDEVWLVVDQLQSAASHAYRLHWLFPDIAHAWNGLDQITLHLPEAEYAVTTGLIAGTKTTSLQRAADDSVRGWRSIYYYAREPALSLEMTTQAKSALFWTVFSPQPVQVQAEADKIGLTHERWQATLALQPASDILIGAATLTGDVAQHWKVT